MDVVNGSFEINQIVDSKWLIKKNICEGGFGAVYEVGSVESPNERYAMKINLSSDYGMEQLMKLEIILLKKLKGRNPSFPECYSYGIFQRRRYLVMELLGPSLSDVQSNLKCERFTTGTALRIGIQLIDALETMHNLYYVHRDIKPGNMAIGNEKIRRIYLFDFGLVRRFVIRKSDGSLDFRQERPNAPFRGTFHYCSLRQHRHRDAGRCDDLWSLMYTLIEFLSGALPWDHEKDRERIEEMKAETPIDVLLQGCPLVFAPLIGYLGQLNFRSRPSYSIFRHSFHRILSARGVSSADPYDWELTNVQLSKHQRRRTVSNKAVYDVASALTSISDVSFNDREAESSIAADSQMSIRE